VAGGGLGSGDRVDSGTDDEGISDGGDGEASFDVRLSDIILGEEETVGGEMPLGDGIVAIDESGGSGVPLAAGSGELSSVFGNANTLGVTGEEISLVTNDEGLDTFDKGTSGGGDGGNLCGGDGESSDGGDGGTRGIGESCCCCIGACFLSSCKISSEFSNITGRGGDTSLNISNIGDSSSVSSSDANSFPVGLLVSAISVSRLTSSAPTPSHSTSSAFSSSSTLSSSSAFSFSSVVFFSSPIFLNTSSSIVDRNTSFFVSHA